MVRLLSEGQYKLSLSKKQTYIIHLEKNNVFEWIKKSPGNFELYFIQHSLDKNEIVYKTGKYRLYEVKNEPELTDCIHLELHTEDGTWDGYLLLEGLPNNVQERKRIIPTREVITKSLANYLNNTYTIFEYVSF